MINKNTTKILFLYNCKAVEKNNETTLLEIAQYTKISKYI